MVVIIYYFIKRWFTVAEWLKHSPATLEVTGSRPTFGGISEIYFLESIQSPARRDLKLSVWHCGNYLCPVMSAVITGKKLPRYQDGPL